MSAVARADEGAPIMRVRPSARPLTLPGGVFAAETGWLVERSDIFEDNQSLVASSLGLRVGLSDAFEVGLRPIAVRFTPDAAFRGFSAGFAVSHQVGPAQFGARLETFMSVESDALRMVTLAFPLRLSFEPVRVDTGLSLALLTAKGTDPQLLLAARQRLTTPALEAQGVPVAFTFDIDDNAYVRASTGVLLDFAVSGGERTWLVPVGFAAGGSVGNARRTFADLSFALEFPFFYASDTDEVTTDTLQLRLIANVFFRGFAAPE